MQLLSSCMRRREEWSTRSWVEDPESGRLWAGMLCTEDICCLARTICRERVNTSHATMLTG